MLKPLSLLTSFLCLLWEKKGNEFGRYFFTQINASKNSPTRSSRGQVKHTSTTIVKILWTCFVVILQPFLEGYKFVSLWYERSIYAGHEKAIKRDYIVKSLFENENDKKIICIKTKSFNKQQHVAPLNAKANYDYGMHNGNIPGQNTRCKLIHAPLGISTAPDLWMARVICIQPITLKKETMHRYTIP